MPVPFIDLKRFEDGFLDRWAQKCAHISANTMFVGGPETAAMEARLAEESGAAAVVGCANGTDAIELALRGIGIRPGGEVILPANTFIATAEAVSRVGARPVVVDVDPAYLLVDPEAVRAAVTPRTEAIIPVHLFGQVAPMEEILKVAADAGVAVVEDAAQSQGAVRHGRSAGSWGQAAATSFYPGKNLGAAGDAGAVLTDDPEVAARVRVIGAHGSARKYDHEVVGVNSRLDAVQAVVLRAKLKRLDAWNERRRAAAAYYEQLLTDVDGVTVPRTAEGNVDVWHLYVVQVDERDRVLAELNGAGIGAGIHYPVPVHLTGAYADLGMRRGACPVAEAAADRILSLPLYPHLTREQQDRVVEVLAAAVSGPWRSGWSWST